MISFSRVATTTIALPFFLFVSTSTWAVNTILSGMFDGAEPAIKALHNYGCAQEPLGYVQTTFRVSTGGNYNVWDAFENLYRVGGNPVFFRVYRGSFNPTMPEQNSVGRVGADAYRLDAGVSYVLVVQRLCENAEGAWAMRFVGPGAITSDAVAAVPNFTSGKFKAGDPTLPGDPWSADPTRYHQSGPIRVQRDGTYYFADMIIGAQVYLKIYTAPVDPANPEANHVGSALGAEPIELQTGQDYYFVVQWVSGDQNGEYLYILAPPAPFRINPGLTGSWHNPDTPGQGFFLSAYEKINQVFLAWFTYADEPSAGDGFGHRWMTAFGNFEGASAGLDIEWTEGGAFDAATPAPEQHVDGTVELEFTDCTSGQVSYSWGGGASGSPAVSGVIPIKRPANDSVSLCESLYAGPGMPGPL